MRRYSTTHNALLETSLRYFVGKDDKAFFRRIDDGYDDAKGAIFLYHLYIPLSTYAKFALVANKK